MPNPKNTRVIIFGIHSLDWMSALGPDGPVWKTLPEVVEVLNLPGRPDEVIPPARAAGCRTVIIPLMENHTLSCPRQEAATLIPDVRSLKILGDKKLFSEYVQANRLERFCARTYRDGEAIAFPCVLKRTNLSSGRGVAIAESPEHLRSLLEQDLWKGHEWILQEKIGDGQEYVTHAVYDRGNLIWSCTFAYELQPGEIIRTSFCIRSARMVEPEPRILRELQSLLKPLRYSGPMNVDYKVNKQGRLFVFEINPRLGGSLMKPPHLTQLQGALSCIIKHAREPVQPGLWRKFRDNLASIHHRIAHRLENGNSMLP